MNKMYVDIYFLSVQVNWCVLKIQLTDQWQGGDGKMKVPMKMQA